MMTRWQHDALTTRGTWRWWWRDNDAQRGGDDDVRTMVKQRWERRW